MSLLDMDALNCIPTWWLPKPLFHVGAGFSPVLSKLVGICLTHC
jgi:hypothetical protein